MVNQLAANNWDIIRCLDTDLDLTASYAGDHDFDVVANEKRFADTAGKYKVTGHVNLQSPTCRQILLGIIDQRVRFLRLLRF